ncbi:bifunctional phosphopantothenoylcysteine decarboxylase/phosphopantothenate--cysteine ligase CoaBC [Desulfosporosinus sp. BICA1-9]|uniref:bifunctional phosphopantothenoylcysteine decarboxylase/phosphopantothenate--cysteine ligase CoaBC n=1 Tax=Desulfosporosinus sp. BICA1-9 TaxID=1531958 RepID=UPI00054B2B74|nr:bifunctional phosphopantothenoylcysteine decarboxylase/phosphopantothenate--cysteine ligase CoaBC [Desulfosporosinus sp. BICA1-9]KJS49160.1 MAG: phosphopantothenoylcysteine decarboxylase [Peptococcaceae bacterium BRH_c23]KJS90465.1 MAG: phosphopantothenoylcysteine decarboxylase [Desulfosporosinus sp. BICA1-9]HBW36287.1 bifunctional phosphopantothenoylcysteine decarboxylase/phosphopantothenate--cysteine ligase CoaBC [Desulfosporosinus sp.]
MFTGRKILVGVTGGIAAYKAAEVVSRLRKLNAEVHVAMTKSATEFITPLTLRSLSANPVYVDMFDEPKHWNVEHIALAEHIDAVIVAPATANILAKMTTGLADDFLSTVLLATRVPIFVAPAMNQAMYHHPATQANLTRLQERGIKIIGPGTGFQACGTEGVGRMSEAIEIVESLAQFFSGSDWLKGKKVLVTAGGTQEPLDPVRYLGNRSSGRMGYAIAQALQEVGAETVLISAPTDLPTPQGVTRVSVQTALEMYDAVLERFPEVDVVIKAAAVADYRPAVLAEQKIKKDGTNRTLELVPNPDILAELGRKKTSQILIGFAAETENLMANAQAKMLRKNVNLLVANDVTKQGAGFGSPTNIVSFLFPDGRRIDFPQMSKLEVARNLVGEIANLLGVKTKE